MRMTPTIFILTTGPWSWSSGSGVVPSSDRREVGRRVAVEGQRLPDAGAELHRRLVDDHLVVAGGVGQPAGEHLGPLDRVPPAVAHRGERSGVRAQLAEPPGPEREAAPRRHLGDRAQLGDVGVTDADLAGEEHGVGRLQLLAHPGVGRGRALGAGDGRRDQPDRQPRHHAEQQQRRPAPPHLTPEPDPQGGPGPRPIHELTVRPEPGGGHPGSRCPAGGAVRTRLSTDAASCVAGAVRSQAAEIAPGATWAACWRTRQVASRRSAERPPTDRRVAETTLAPGNISRSCVLARPAPEPFRPQSRPQPKSTSR